MSEKITIIVDFTPDGLREKAKLFNVLANTLEINTTAKTETTSAPAANSAPPAPPAPNAAQAIIDDLDDGDDDSNTGGESEPNAAQVFGAAGNVELDAEGIPWDGRIHAPSKAKLKKTDTWKLKRGIDKTYADKILAELKQTMQGAKPANTQQPPLIPPAASSAPPTPPTPPAPVQTTEVTFSDLVKKITSNLSEGNITNAQVNEMLHTFDIASVPMLKNRPDVWGMVDQHLDSLLS